ncbi:hypothetical protein BDR22DRAFT_470385 [Usnea florida]
MPFSPAAFALKRPSSRMVKALNLKITFRWTLGVLSGHLFTHRYATNPRGLSCLDANRVLHKQLVDAGALRLRSRSACTSNKVTLASSSHLVSMDLSSTLCFCIAAGRSVRSTATAVVCATLPVAYADQMPPAVRQTVYACVFIEPRGSWH